MGLTEVYKWTDKTIEISKLTELHKNELMKLYKKIDGQLTRLQMIRLTDWVV